MTWFDFIQKLSLWDWLFWSLVLIDFVWLALPPLVYLFYGSLSTHRVELGMDDADLPVDPRVCNQLLALGLLPLGAVRSRHWLTCNGWNQRVRQYVFGGGDSRCLVLVWTTYEGESPYIRFLSFFQDGHCISTSNEYVGQFRLGKHAARGLLIGSASRLAEFHFEKVGTWTAIGYPLCRHDKADLLLTYARQAARLPGSVRITQVSLRLVVLYGLVFCIVGTIFLFGFDTLMLALGLMVAQLLPLYVWLRLALFPSNQREAALLVSQQREEATAEHFDQASGGREPAVGTADDLAH